MTRNLGGYLAEITRQPFRSDIQGLRAVAVGLVVLYHASLPGLTGGYVGVDVFFVISGFLITNHLLSSLLGHGRIQFASFYAKRARRILPASLVVAVLTVVAAVIWIAPLQLKSTFQDAIATVLYVPNMLFAFQNTDYLADHTPSLFQHYWSLGVEEQFYLVWPALLAAGFLLVRRSERRLFWGLVVMVAVSFAIGVYLTSAAQPWAFFSLPTRAWELGVGGLLAFATSSRRWSPSPAVSRIGGWAGVAGLLAVAVFYTDATVFPGFAAVAPVASAAAIIYFGGRGVRGDPGVLLQLRGMVFIGTISYSLYLVHWPALVIPAQAGGIERTLPLWLSLGIAIACVPLAWALYRFVEVPGQKWNVLKAARPRRTLVAVATVSVLIVGTCGAGIVLVARTPLQSDESAAAPTFDAPPDFTSYVPDNVVPKLTAAAASNPTIYASGCHVDEATTTPKGCEFGSDDSAPLVELFGDSHAAQWFPALDRLADDGVIRLRVDTKSSCPSFEIAKLEDGVPYVACDEWRAAVLLELKTVKPDVVILANYARSAGFAQTTDFVSDWRSGIQSTVEQLPETSQVFVMSDTPTMPFNPAVCLSAHLHDADACGVDRADAVDDALHTAEKSATDGAGARYVDLTDHICSPSRCEPISGDVLIYRDDNHLTPQFSEGLSAALAENLDLGRQ
ncbi:acyltransferase family protein [Herbiconiux sp. P18]|uniref:acyltransferase family protein n=1 Tax=Herbiconiux liangxiaofengii TaxID=3342795 RepID=UPI0035B6EA98